jgi:hypothetical protein
MAIDGHKMINTVYEMLSQFSARAVWLAEAKHGFSSPFDVFGSKVLESAGPCTTPQLGRY